MLPLQLKENSQLHFCPQTSTIKCNLLANKVHAKPSNHLQSRTFNTPTNKRKLKPLPMKIFSKPRVKLAEIFYCSNSLAQPKRIQVGQTKCKNLEAQTWGRERERTKHH